MIVLGSFDVPIKHTEGGPESGHGPALSGRMGTHPAFSAAVDDLIAQCVTDPGDWVRWTDGFRSYELQELTRKRKGSLASLPGNSLHGWHVAADLEFSSDKVKLRMHQHAKEHGLRFLGSFGQSEDWHIQPLLLVRRAELLDIVYYGSMEGMSVDTWKGEYILVEATSEGQLGAVKAYCGYTQSAGVWSEKPTQAPWIALLPTHDPLQKVAHANTAKAEDLHGWLVSREVHHTVLPMSQDGFRRSVVY